jgi:hypothetical protein
MCRRLSRALSRWGAKEMTSYFRIRRRYTTVPCISSSVTTGDFEQFIARESGHIHRRPLPDHPKSTGPWLGGTLDGGYGATRIGMKHADVFGSLYVMSPCCLSPRPVAPPADPELAKAIEAVKTPQDSSKLSFFARAQLATAAAWSPNPKNLRFILICRH